MGPCNLGWLFGVWACLYATANALVVDKSIHVSGIATAFQTFGFEETGTIDLSGHVTGGLNSSVLVCIDKEWYCLSNIFDHAVYQLF